jgi:hypothetical protein
MQQLRAKVTGDFLDEKRRALTHFLAARTRAVGRRRSEHDSKGTAFKLWTMEVNRLAWPREQRSVLFSVEKRQF